MRIFIIGFLLIFAVSCERADIKDVSESMRLIKKPISLDDDLPLDVFSEAISKNIERLNEIKQTELEFGPKIVNKNEYVQALELLRSKIDDGISKYEFLKYLDTHFDFYEVYGNDKWGQVFITSYFAPAYNGSRERTVRHSQALYSVPNDLVDIEIDEFIETERKLSALKDSNTDKPLINTLRGRLDESSDKTRVVPYYTRRQIDGAGKLSDQDIVLAWVDPIDAFFLHVQGSGTIIFEDGEELTLGYASQNGHKYESIGKHLFDVIPKEKMSMQAIDNYLRTISYKEMKEVLYKNPSYIFFRKLEGKPLTFFGTEVVAGRTIATDKRYFPQGALAYLQFPSPVFNDDSSIEPSSFKDSSRFVINQDTGGAIKGPGRVDLFWGSGKEAARYAGVMKNEGKLYFLVPKD